jgi:hypothetical protein
MKRSQRGAARVSIAWMVTAIVLLMVAMVFGYFGFDAAAKAKAAEQAARAREAKAIDDEALQAKKVIELSRLVGWYDEAVATPDTNLTALRTDFEDFKSTFPDMGGEVNTLAKSLPIAKQSYTARGREIGTLNDSIATLKSERDTMEQGLRAAIAQKDGEITDLQRQLTDAANNAAQRQTELETRIATLNQQRNDLDAQLREARGQLEEAERRFAAERQQWETRTRAMAEVLKFTKEPEAADGRVLQVSKDLALGWIDIGANHRLARGMRFRVVSGTTGSRALKAWCEVTKVEPTMAEVMFSEVADRFDPVVSGDVVYNPVYDPTGERNAVLAGRFSGQFNEPELKVLLERMGIHVQPALNFDTDYLIVGSELYTDEEGNALEEPLQPQDLSVYKDAEALGVQIVSIKSLRDYFRM